MPRHEAFIYFLHKTPEHMLSSLLDHQDPLITEPDRDSHSSCVHYLHSPRPPPDNKQAWVVWTSTEFQTVKNLPSGESLDHFMLLTNKTVSPLAI